MNLSQLQQRVASRYRDVNSSGMRDLPTITGDLNARYLEFVSAIGDQAKEALATLTYPTATPGQMSTQPLPSGCTRITSCRATQASASGTPFSLLPLTSWQEVLDRYQNPTVAGNAYYYFPYGQLLYLFPACVQPYVVEIAYWGDPALLASPTDTPVFPARYHEALVDGALALAYTDDQDLKRAQYHEGRFMAQLKKAQDDLYEARTEIYAHVRDDFFVERY